MNGKKAWETRRKNGNNKQPGSGKKAHQTAIKNGNHFGATKESAQRSVETKRKNGLNLSEIALRGNNTKRKLGIKIGPSSETIKNLWQNQEYRVKQIASRKIQNKPEIKRKLRIALLNHILLTGNLRIGKHEKELLDKQEQIDNCKILRQYYIKDLGYITDGYCSENNAIYEIYEQKHQRQRIHDMLREAQIVSKLNCRFVKIWDISPDYLTLHNPIYEIKK